VSGMQSSRERAKKHGTGSLAAIGITLLMVLLNGRCFADTKQAEPGAVGKTARDFSLNDLSGRRVRLSDFKGKVVLLDFWATWCAPCLREVPNFVQMQGKYKDKGFTILAVSLDEEGLAVVKPVAQRLRINYPVAIGSTQVADEYGGIQALPTVFLIGRDGTILQTFVGVADKSKYEDAIQSALRATN
jgi:peroxiredoxin